MKARALASLLCVAALLWSGGGRAMAQGEGAPAGEAAAWAALRGGAILLLRHANAPGNGDPAGLSLGDCTSQRNLDEAGRTQARRIGERLRQERVVVGALWASQW